MVTDRLQNEESKKKNAEVVPSESVALISKNQERRGRSQSRNFCQQNNDNPRGKSKLRGEASSVFIVRKCVM